MDKWLNRPFTSISEKDLQNLGLKEIVMKPITILNDFFIISKSL